MSTFFAVRDEIAEKLKEIPEFLKIYTPLNSVSVTEHVASHAVGTRQFCPYR